MSNAIKIQVYSSGTTAVYDPGELPIAEGLTFSTLYPGGLYGQASFFIARDPTRSWQLKQGQRVTLSNGLKMVWEGVILSHSNIWAADTRGRLVTCIGKWGDLMMRRRWRKRWVDDRYTEDVWQWQLSSAVHDKCFLERQNRLHFVPKAEAWTNGQYAAVTYTMPTGETVKKVSYGYDLAEGAQQWEISLWRSTDGSSYTQMTNASGETYGAGTTTVIVATGTGTVSVTLATPSQYLQFRFYARADQTPTSDGTYYATIDDLLVYSETSSINGYEIAKDIRGVLTELNSDETHLGSSLNYGLSPFLAEDTPTVADILAAATEYGDSSFNAWAYGLLASEDATTPDGKPVLFLEQWPVLTDYDYIVYHEDKNLVSTLEIEWTLDDTWNSIIVVYQNTEGQTVRLNALDDSNLKDTASADEFGTRQYVLHIPGRHATSATAINAGRRFLAQHKDRQFRVSPFTVQGYIKLKNGNPVPACEIRAGKRVKFGDYIDDGTGTWQTHVVTGTDYDDTAETCRVSVGKPDLWGIYSAQLERRVGGR